MNRLAAWSLIAALFAATAVAFLVPLEGASILAGAALLAARRHRVAVLALAASMLAIQGLLFGVLAGEASLRWGPIAWSWEGAQQGLHGGLRLVAVLAVNIAMLSWISVQRLLDGLALPAGATAFLGAVALSARDLGRDATQLVHAARLDGQWPTSRLRRITAAARLLPALLVLAVRRATTRAEALHLAGHPTGPRFAALVAVTALAAAGRLAFVALPNVSLTYIVVFAGGFLFGPRVGAGAGALAMALTNLLLTGLYVVPFANVPAMAFLGLLGGWLQALDLASDRWLGRMTAGAIGFVMTMAFSVLADLGTWLLVPEFRGDITALRILLTAGVAFNALPGASNAVLFAMAITPLSRAAQALGWTAPKQPAVPAP